jgi:hypothetical protein
LHAHIFLSLSLFSSLLFSSLSLSLTKKGEPPRSWTALMKGTEEKDGVEGRSSERA